MSNAALRSKRIRIETLFSSEFSLRSLIILVRAVSLLWCFLKPNWNSSRMLSLRKEFICTETVFSSILLMNGRLEMGLYQLSMLSSKLGFFGRGFTTAAVLEASGKMPV